MKSFESVGLSQLANRVCGALSHGDQKVLEIAIAMGNDPELLILDEPTAGMSPDETANTINLINRLTKDMGLTILFCEHDMELVFSIADKIMCMQQGVSLIQGNPDEVRCNKLVQEAYLGGPELMLQVQAIHTFYGLSHILFDVSLNVAKGEIVCLLGRNGAGKSTIMKSIMGLTPPRQGTVTFKGEVISGKKPYQIARRGIGFVPDDRRVFADLTVGENLEISERKTDENADME